MLSLPTLPVNLQANLQALHERITKAARAAGRDPSSVRLLAVTKAFGADAILSAAAAGQRAFGENYAQEAAAKMLAIKTLRPDLAFEWHFIGPIQSNKTRAIAQAFDWVQSVDRLSVAERLAQQRPPELPLLNVLLQVNISGERSKAGAAPEDLRQLAEAAARLPRLRLRGLMAIPAPETDVARQRIAFAQAHALFRQLCQNGLDLDVLSMGMSDDLDAAIAEGSTMVRIGTAIFGARVSNR
ncbi:MAG TPA: YggS family pyridoxal phosphate-dependent enzyme [Burkholderiaceae bacterium]|nr:YggS family pyridoxal phosphate-dependent enzyme [Burkholderiaceae bacterium]